jgi:hypothetical protein
MSASRSVAAAQRRRAGPPEPQQQARGPNTSINSSQVFSPNQQQQQQQQQLRPGTSGRLAGQQAALQQQQFQQAQAQKQTQGQGQGQGSKMSVAQAITLITLRLGRVEQQLQQYDPSSNTLSNENVDSSLIDSILQRLYTLEQQDPNISNDNQDFSNIKQQIESIKGNFVGIRNTFAVNGKVLDSYKVEIESLKAELLETKNLLHLLQNEKFDENDQVDYIDGPCLSNINEVEFITHNEELKLDDSSSDTEDVEMISTIEINISEEENPIELENKEETVSLKEIIQQELKQSGVSLTSSDPIHVHVPVPVNNKRGPKLQYKGNK